MPEDEGYLVEELLTEVKTELSKAMTAYPWWPKTIVAQAAIAAEESGEVVKAANNYYWDHDIDTLDDIEQEAIQAAAMFVRFAINVRLSRGDGGMPRATPDDQLE